MSRIHTVDDKNIPFTAAEEAAQDAEEAAIKADRPMEEWKAAMAESDSAMMPRWTEDHIEFDHAGSTAGVDLQAKYDDKKTLRAQRPKLQ